MFTRNIVLIKDDNKKEVKKSFLWYLFLGLISQFIKKETSTLLACYIIIDNFHNVIKQIWPDKYMRNMFLYSVHCMFLIPIYFKNKNKFHPSYRKFLSSTMEPLLKKRHLKVFKMSYISCIPYLLVYIFKSLYLKKKIYINYAIERFSRASMFVYIITYIFKMVHSFPGQLGCFLPGIAFTLIEHPSQLDPIQNFVWSQILYTKMITLS